MDLNVQDKRALVTAASKGLGRAVTSQLVAEGATVVISSRSEENLETARSAILSETGADESSIRTVVCDLADPEEIQSQVGDAIDDLGGLDMLVTNHGGTEPLTFEEATVDNFGAAYDAVVQSTIVTVKTALPALKDGGGSITNLVAASALEPSANTALNGTIRPAIYGLSKTLSEEYANDGIRTNCVCPRSIMTDRIEYKFKVMADEENLTMEEAKGERLEEMPIDRLGSPEEFAKAVAFVASPAASFITGTALQIDGGWYRYAF